MPLPSYQEINIDGRSTSIISSQSGSTGTMPPTAAEHSVELRHAKLLRIQFVPLQSHFKAGSNAAQESVEGANGFSLFLGAL